MYQTVTNQRNKLQSRDPPRLLVVANFDTRLASMAMDATMHPAGVRHISGLNKLLVFFGGVHLGK